MRALAIGKTPGLYYVFKRSIITLYGRPLVIEKCLPEYFYLRLIVREQLARPSCMMAGRPSVVEMSK